MFVPGSVVRESLNKKTRLLREIKRGSYEFKANEALKVEYGLDAKRGTVIQEKQEQFGKIKPLCMPEKAFKQREARLKLLSKYKQEFERLKGLNPVLKQTDLPGHAQRVENIKFREKPWRKSENRTAS